MNPSEANEKSGRAHPAMRLLPAAALALLTVQAVAQSQSIILNTSPTPTEIELLDGADVNLDPVSGDLTATPLDPAACSATTDCSDVQVSITGFSEIGRHTSELQSLRRISYAVFCLKKKKKEQKKTKKRTNKRKKRIKNEKEQ